MATVRCEEIANEKHAAFVGNEVRFSYITTLLSQNLVNNLTSWALNYVIITGVESVGAGRSIGPHSWLWKEAQFNH